MRKRAAKKTAGKDTGGPEGLVNVQLLGALYEPYPQDFSSKYFSPTTVTKSVKNIKAAGFTRDTLQWGYYQKYAPDDPTDQTNWVDAKLYQNWEAAIAEAREALQKMPVDPSQPGPDPDNPGVLASNMLDHLDKAVRIALFDKHFALTPDSGIEIEVSVGKQSKPSRRHNVTTAWRRAKANPSDPKYKWDRLSIVMTCPLGGWVGTAAWKYVGPSRFTRYTATYEVPAAPPSSSGQILFIFNGLESLPDPQQSDPPGILQPVLQWTKHDGWAIRSWYVPSTYTPSIDQMPKLDDELKFTDPGSPAWTKATRVSAGDILTGVIDWNGTAYRSSFVVNGAATTPTAMLTAQNILPLTYPVAVIEAYEFSVKDLVDAVTITDITLYREDAPGVPLEPTWDIGTDTKSSDNIHYGTGMLQLYKITPDDNNATLKFTKKTGALKREP
jgi:hypothetical protein